MLSRNMDPNTSKAPGLALPNPSGEGGVRSAVSDRAPESSHEVMMPSIEVMPSNGAPAVAPPAVPRPAPAMSPVATPPMQQPAAVTVADDTASDELDVEWVNKAKAIIEQTKDDPYRESRELGKVKADYLRIRYNKTIKVVEE